MVTLLDNKIEILWNCHNVTYICSYAQGIWKVCKINRVCTTSQTFRYSL